MPKKTKEIWCDLLCLSSALRIILLSRRYAIKECRYLNCTSMFKPFVPLFKQYIKAPVSQVLDIIEGEEKIEGMSMYEYARAQTVQCIEQWIQSGRMSRHVTLFCERHGFNKDKYEAHLKDAAFYSVLRPVTIAMYAQKFSEDGRAVVLLRKSPLKHALSGYLSAHEIDFYPALLILKKITPREGYLLDATVNRKYYANQFIEASKFVCCWMTDCLLGALASCVRLFQKKQRGDGEVRVGLELTQHRVREDEINDIVWLKASGINPDSVCGITGHTFDEISCDTLDKYNIRVFKGGRNIFKLAEYYLRYCRRVKPHTIISPGSSYGVKTVLSVLGLLKVIFMPAEQKWSRFNEVKYYCRTMYWNLVYQLLGIKLVYTMIDVDEDKLPKGQALEMQGGLFTGGHWSNYLIYHIDLQRCCDVLFTWGEHFIQNNFNRYPFLATFLTGYPNDHYFKDYKEKSSRLRQKYPNKFIVCYTDSGMGHDVAFSKKMQVDMHAMFCQLLKEHKHLMLFLKPKRVHVFKRMAQEVDGLDHMLESGRIQVFVGETKSAKAVPAYVAMASDLVIGLGVSTAAAECHFAKTVSYHADLTGFVHNGFANTGSGKVVFRDIPSLKKAIEERVTQANAASHEDFRPYYDMLDPYQDGRALWRIGFIMQKLQQRLQEGLNRQEAVANVKKEFGSSVEYKPKFEEAYLH